MADSSSSRLCGMCFLKNNCVKKKNCVCIYERRVWAQLLRWQDSLEEPVLSFHLWIPQMKLWLPGLPYKAASTHWAIGLAHILLPGKVYGPGQPITHHVAQASLKLSAIFQPLPPECCVRHITLPACDTYFWSPFWNRWHVTTCGFSASPSGHL